MQLIRRDQFQNGQKVKLISPIYGTAEGVISINDGLIYFCSDNSIYCGSVIPESQKFGKCYSWRLSFNSFNSLVGYYLIYTVDDLYIDILYKSNNILFSKYKFLI